MLSPWVTQLGMEGTSAQNPPFSALRTTTWIFIRIGGGGGGSRTHVRNGCHTRAYVCIYFVVYSTRTLRNSKMSPNLVRLMSA